MEHESSLRDALSYDGDLELRFQGGEAIPVHSQKLKLASSVLRDLITAVLDDMIASSAAKRRRTAEGSGSITEERELPSLKVRRQVSKQAFILLQLSGMAAWSRILHVPPPTPMRRCGKSRLTAPMRTGWRF